MQTHQRTWWTVENFAFLRRNDFLDEKNPSTPRNWEHLCHQRKNAVNNWTIIDRQPFEYEAICNVAVEGKLQNASAAWLSLARAAPFVLLTACGVLTSQEPAGSAAGSPGLSTSIILHIRHIMKKEQAERSLSIYFLQHPSLSTPLTPWQTAQPAASPRQLTRSTQQIFSVSWQTLVTSCLKHYYPPCFQQANPTWKGRHVEPPGSLQPCWLPTPLQEWPTETLPGSSQWHRTAAGHLQNVRKGPGDLSNTQPWFISNSSSQKGLSPGRGVWAGHTLLPGTHLCTSPMPLLSRTSLVAACCGIAAWGENALGYLPGQNRQNKSDQLSCDFMASCTDIHVLLCTVSLITSFQKDRQRNEWVVKHAHKNIIACLGAFVSCLWFTGYPVLHFLITCTFPLQNKLSMCMQFILISLPPHKMIKLLQPCKNGNIVVTRFIIQ